MDSNDYSAQAQALYGKTEAYKEFQQKYANRTDAQKQSVESQVTDFFVRLGNLRPCDPGCAAAQAWAKELQTFFTEHFYTCTPQIFSGLGNLYASGGKITENIDNAGGAGTGAFAKEVIDIYLKNL